MGPVDVVELLPGGQLRGQVDVVGVVEELVELDTDFAANGQPQTTVFRDASLAYGADPEDLTQYASYDGFGNLLSETDTSGTRTTQTNTYDLAGRLLTEADAGGTVTHHAYDALGNEVV